MIHFSHGNGFPSETYHQIIKQLRNKTKVGYVSCLGHSQDYPVTDHWPNLVDELIEFVSKNYDSKVVAIGHSLGGVLSYLACIKKPELFKGVILLDAPIFPAWKTKIIWIIKTIGLSEYLSPAPFGTKTRRTTWPSYQAALEHFSGKEVFKSFHPNCLRDYVYLGTELVREDSNEIKLKFDPIVEWKIYRMLPTISIPKLPEHIPCGLIYGQRSRVIREKDAMFMQRNYGIKYIKLFNCGHLFPFEKPKETVNAIYDLLEDFKIIL